MFHDVYEASQGDVRLPVEETAASGALAALAMGQPPKNPHVFKDLPTQTSDSLSQPNQRIIQLMVQNSGKLTSWRW